MRAILVIGAFPRICVVHERVDAAPERAGVVDYAIFVRGGKKDAVPSPIFEDDVRLPIVSGKILPMLTRNFFQPNEVHVGQLHFRAQATESAREADCWHRRKENLEGVPFRRVEVIVDFPGGAGGFCA
jgi:hypothetical protein